MLTNGTARRIFCATFLSLLVCILAPARAAEVAGLYTAEVPVDQASRTPREDAYRMALYDVLLRVSGPGLADDTELVDALFPTASAYVVQFRPGPDDTLIVTFDGEAVERALRSSRQTVWGAERPLTLVWLAVDWGEGEREILGVDDPMRETDDARSIDRNRLLRERLNALAERRGLPLLLPLMDTEDREQVTYADIRGGFDEIVLAASARYEVDSVLVGVIDAEAIEPNRWRYYFGREVFDWRGEPEQILPLVADRLAEEFAIQGDAPVRTVSLRIGGIQTVDAYGDLQQRLAGLELIERFAIDSVNGDTITYQVDVRGGAERLARALRFAGLLEAERIDTGYGSGFGTGSADPAETRRYDDAMDFNDTLNFFYEPR